MHDTYDPLVGKLTYDDAVIRLGPPTSSAQITDGIVCQWVLKHNMAAVAMPAGTNTVYAGGIRTKQLTMVFKKGIMVSWQYGRGH
jgi:hypothetical protein